MSGLNKLLVSERKLKVLGFTVVQQALPLRSRKVFLFPFLSYVHYQNNIICTKTTNMQHKMPLKKLTKAALKVKIHKIVYKNMDIHKTTPRLYLISIPFVPWQR